MADLDARTPPNDRNAEAALLGWIMMAGRIPEEAEALKPDHFYYPGHMDVWKAITDLAKAKTPPDIYAVEAKLTERGQLVKLSGRNSTGTSALHDMVSGVPGWPPTLVELIIDRYTRRELIEEGDRIARDARLEETPSDQQVEAAEKRLSALAGSRVVDQVDTLLPLGDFLGVEAPEPEWVMPGYLCRDERLMLTGPEGLGKSTLTRQLAMCAAAGMDPFTGHFGPPPMTVLVVDVENSVYVMKQRFREISQAINAHGGIIEPGRLWIDRRPAGMDLSKPPDRRWLRQRMRAVNPDILVIGPAYKLIDARGRDSHEDIAADLATPLDEMRTEVNCALILEAHAAKAIVNGKRTLEPIGSSYWMRWTDFGYGIRPAGGQEGKARRQVEFEEWKGPRDPRRWPEEMVSGGVGLPWVEWATAA
jgi:replicative DNA helicase